MQTAQGMLDIIENPFLWNWITLKKQSTHLDGYEGRIGMMGGDPTLHPKFKEICEIYQKNSR